VKRVALAIFAILLVASAAYAHRKARTVVDEGRPIAIYLTDGKKTYIRFPEPILGFDAPVAPDQVRLSLVDGYPETLVVWPVDFRSAISGSGYDWLELSIPTTGAVHILRFLPAASNDTSITIRMPQASSPPPLTQEKRQKNGHPYRLASEAPVRDGLIELMYAMYDPDSDYGGVTRRPVHRVLVHTDLEQQTVLWHFTGRAGLYGYIIKVVNRGQAEVTLDHAHLRDAGALLYATSLSNTEYESVERLARGEAGYLHLIYLRGARP
jgi:hypothetical protein